MRLAIVHTPPGSRAGTIHSNGEQEEKSLPLGRVTGLRGEGTSGDQAVFNARDEPRGGDEVLDEFRIPDS
jgi:hypothetical protein